MKKKIHDKHIITNILFKKILCNTEKKPKINKDYYSKVINILKTRLLIRIKI